MFSFLFFELLVVYSGSNLGGGSHNLFIECIMQGNICLIVTVPFHHTQAYLMNIVPSTNVGITSFQAMFYGWKQEEFNLIFHLYI
jgi:hypothetical protein